MLHDITERLAAELPRPGSLPRWSVLQWKLAQAVSAMHGVSGMLAGSLTWQGPESWNRFLQQQRVHTEHRARRIEELLQYIDIGTRLARVPTVALKGAELHSRGLYRAGERPMADIDLLVRPVARASATRVLMSLGFQEKVASKRHRVFESATHASPGHLGEHAGSPIKIELHEYITEELPLHVEDVTDIVFPSDPHPGLNAYPSKAALMIHLLLHAAGAMRVRTLRMLHLVDLARLSADLSPADWHQVLSLGKVGRKHWWASPPLRLVCLYYPKVVPAEVLSAMTQHSSRLLTWVSQRRTLSDYSFSYPWIEAFPGIEWCQSPTEMIRYIAHRIVPNRAVLTLRKETLRVDPIQAASQWHRESQMRRILRWLVSRPTRAQTLHTVSVALGRTP